MSLYLSGMRGKTDISDARIQYEINIYAERIIKHGNGTVVSEICRLCKLFTSKEEYFW